MWIVQFVDAGGKRRVGIARGAQTVEMLTGVRTVYSGVVTVDDPFTMTVL